LLHTVPLDGSAVGGDEANMSRSPRKVFSNFSKGFLRGMALTSALGGNNSNSSDNNVRKSTSTFSRGCRGIEEAENGILQWLAWHTNSRRACLGLGIGRRAGVMWSVHLPYHSRSVPKHSLCRTTPDRDTPEGLFPCPLILAWHNPR
jgi:hypothetical protein